MGSVLNSQRRQRDDDENSIVNLYCYPPNHGNYFSDYFIMGGEKFTTTQPESYLFGEVNDLNFTGQKPLPFPYPTPNPYDPIKALKCLINIRRESLKFVKNSIYENKPNEYNIEFILDANCNCSVTINFFCVEEVINNIPVYRSQNSKLISETFYFEKGTNQLFSLSSHPINPKKYFEELLVLISEEVEILPIVIICRAIEGNEPRQWQSTIVAIEKQADDIFSLKTLKQKLFVDGITYLMQELYGIENKLQEKSNNSDDEMEEYAAECVICMCDPRDTLILPCRHLCLCNSCADSLRYQSNNCPICRAPFHALLQIRSVKGITVPDSTENYNIDPPMRYELISLTEALNGPHNKHTDCEIKRSILLSEQKNSEKQQLLKKDVNSSWHSLNHIDLITPSPSCIDFSK